MSKALSTSTTLSLSTHASGNTTGSHQKASGLEATNTNPGCVDSMEILRGQKTVEIRHNGSTYRLQATRLGKLILTK